MLRRKGRRNKVTEQINETTQTQVGMQAYFKASYHVLANNGARTWLDMFVTYLKKFVRRTGYI
jgi:hypothetical protein